MRRIALMTVLASLGLLVGCGGSGGTTPLPTPAPSVNNTAAMVWTDAMLDSIRNSTIGPPANSRAIALITTAMYDAWATLDPTAVAVYTPDETMTVTVPNTPQNQDIAVSYAAFRVAADLFPHRRAQLEQVMRDRGLDPYNGTTGPDSAVGIGNMVADRLISQRHLDGSNQLNNYADTSGYSPANTESTLNDPERWQPVTFTMPDGSKRTPKFLVPHWGGVKTFALSSGAELRCPPGLSYGTPEFKAQVDEVINLQKNLTDEQKMISEYWSDGPASETPPGHWILITKHMIRRDNTPLEGQIKMFMLVGNAVMDAGISCWDSKTTHDYVRPISAVRHMYKGQQIQAWAGKEGGLKTIDGSAWKPYQPDSFLTPPFAELPSGHSTFSSASAEVLRAFTGSDRLDYTVTIQPGASKNEPGVTPKRTVTLRYSTLSSAAQAAGMSRLYGGIHFRRGNEDGLQMGQQVGQRVAAKAMNLFAGRR